MFVNIPISPHVRESTKVLDSGSQPLPASGFWIPTLWIPDSNLLDSGFQNHCGFRIPVSGFRIPTTKICWIPDSGFPYMGRPICGHKNKQTQHTQTQKHEHLPKQTNMRTRPKTPPLRYRKHMCHKTNARVFANEFVLF